jgi:hypothetical protein
MNQQVYKTETLLLDRLLDQTTSTNRQAAPVAIIRGIIVDIVENGDLVVKVSPCDTAKPLRCDFLETSANATLQLKRGDQVLVLSPENPEQNGLVLGRIGRYRLPQNQTNQPADHVVFEAKETLTLKCGESSVNLRKDGKLMIRGKDVLTRAKRSQRIKAGTVAIN